MLLKVRALDSFFVVGQPLGNKWVGQLAENLPAVQPVAEGQAKCVGRAELEAIEHHLGNIGDNLCVHVGAT